MREHHVQPAGTSPVVGYSHAVRFDGPMVIVSGQVPIDEHGELVSDDPGEQVEQVFRNLAAALEAAGSGLDRVVKLTIFLTDLADLGVYREVRDRMLGDGPPPASSLVQVAGLVHPGFRVEVEALATA